MQFDTHLRSTMFSYYPDTFAELLESPSLPMGVVASPERLTLQELIDECGEPDMHTLSAEHRAGVVSLRKITRANLVRLQGLPNLRRVAYSDEKSAVLPKEVATLPHLRVLELNLTRKFKKLHKNLALATNLEALLMINLQNLTDVGALASLPKLTHVTFSNTVKLRDYSPLQSLAQLRHLALHSLDLTLAAPTAQTLQLTELDLKGSVFYKSCFPALAALIESQPSLTGLGLAGAVLDHGALPSLDHLQQLNLDGVSRHSEGMFSRARGLKSLSMQFYEAEALPAGFEALSELEALDLSFSKALQGDAGLSSLASLSKLQHLDLSQARQLSRLPESVASLRALRQINLGGSQTQEVSALRGLPALRCANLSGVKDAPHLVDVVMSLPALERVEVAPHIDISALAEHPSLKLILGTRPDPAAVSDRFDVRHSAAFLRR